MGNLSGEYWSSTEGGSSPTTEAFGQGFGAGGGYQGQFIKYAASGVRCSRALTS